MERSVVPGPFESSTSGSPGLSWVASLHTVMHMWLKGVQMESRISAFGEFSSSSGERLKWSHHIYKVTSSENYCAVEPHYKAGTWGRLEIKLGGAPSGHLGGISGSGFTPQIPKSSRKLRCPALLQGTCLGRYSIKAKFAGQSRAGVSREEGGDHGSSGKW